MSWDRLLSIAASRGGVVCLADAARVGVHADAVRRRAGRDGWSRLGDGVWHVAGAPMSSLSRHWAGVLVTEGVLARRSALWQHDLLDRPPPRPVLLVPHGRPGSRRLDLVVHRSRTLRDDHTTTVRDLPLTTVPRTLVDVAGDVTARTLRNLTIDAIRDGRTTHGEVASLRAELRPGVPGLRNLDHVLEQLDSTRSDSGLEHDIRTGLRSAGFPVHPEPYPFACDDGVTVHLDIALPEHWVYVECDGFGTHGTRHAFHADRRKWTQVVRYWRPVWVTADRWHDDRTGVLRDVSAAIALGPPHRR